MSSQKMDSLQYLRAIAATMVVVFHACASIMGEGGYGHTWLRSGVDVFFVISGVVMWVSTAGRGVTTGQFYVHRIRRIVPLYWIVTTVVLAIGLFLPTLLRSTRIEPMHVLASYLFVPYPSPAVGAEGQLWPLLVVGWSLDNEMFYYLLFGLLLPLRERLRAVVVVSGFLGLALAGAVLQPRSPVLDFYMTHHAAEFGIGVAMGAVATSTHRTLPAGLALAALVAGFASLPAVFVIFDNETGASPLIGGVLVTFGALALERAGHLPRIGWLERIGDASYSLYLTHPLVLSASISAASRLGLLTTLPMQLVFVTAATVVAILVSFAVNRWVERPLLALTSGRRRPAGEPGPKVEAVRSAPRSA